MKKTLTIGISAYNEEKNIEHLLRSIFYQRAKNYTLEKVIVLLDGCTDDTYSVLRDLQKQFKQIEIVHDNKRSGKSCRINQLFKLAKSEILVIVDADTALASSNSLEAIVSSFASSKVGLVGGHDTPVKPVTFVEKIISYSGYVWYQIRKDVNKGNTIHNHHSCFSALHKNVYRKILLPKNAIADDDFIFISTMKLGYTFKFAKYAGLKYKCPSNIDEYITQSVRFFKLKKEIVGYFGQESIAYYFIPTKYKVRAFLYCFFNNPLLFVLAMSLQFLTRVSVKREKKTRSNGYWNIISSTKIIPRSELFI